MVPGSTLMYGSSLMLVTRMPRDSRIAAREAAAMPFPREETTPPVTKTYLVMADLVMEILILQHRARCSPLALDCRHESLGQALPQHLARGRRDRDPRHRPVAAAARVRNA